MSFKGTKANFAAYNNPKPKLKANPVVIPGSLANAVIALTAEKINIIAKSEELEENNSSIEATRNKDTSSFHKKLFKKGINVLRPEILLINEYSAIVTGRKVEENQNSINVQYGNNTFVEVTNTARLLELHQILKENAITTADALITRYGNIPSSIHAIIDKLVNLMRFYHKSIYDPNALKMRQNLIQMAIDKENNFSIRSQMNQLTDEVIVLITDYVINDFVAKMLIDYVGNVFDYKDAIESAIELDKKSKTKPTIISKTANNNLARPSLSTSLNIKSLINKNESEFKFEKSTNFENFADIIGYTRSLITLSDTIVDLENEEFSKNDATKITYGKKRRLKRGIEKLKKITFAGCFGHTQRKRTANSDQRMVGSVIKDVINATGVSSNSEAMIELLAALCYDQVTGAVQFQREFRDIDNILSNGEKYVSIIQLLNQETLKWLPKHGGNTYQGQFEKIDTSGELTRYLFQKKISSYDQKEYIPYETNNTISESLYVDNDVFPGEEIFFTSALKNNDIDFKEMERFIAGLKEKWESLTKNIIRSMCLDFDDTGKQSSDDLNTISQLNPLSYLNFYLSLLADDLEKNYINSDRRRKKSLPGLAMLLNNAQSINMTVSSFKSTLMGSLINEGTAAPQFLADQENKDWLTDSKLEGLINTLYSESEAQTEKSFRKLLEGINVDNYPKGERGFPDGGEYDITLTATGLADGNLGTFKKKQHLQLGVDDDNLLKGEGSQYERYNYLHSGEADIELTKTLNLKVTNDWLGPVLLISLAVLTIGTGGAFAALISAGGALAAAAFTAGAILAGSSIVVAGGAAITSLVTAKAVEESKPVGIQLTTAGLFTLYSTLDACLSIGIEDRENLSTPNVGNDDITGGDIYFFINDSGNGKYDFLEVNQPGEFGGIHKFSAVHRSFLFHYFAVKLLADTQRVAVYTDEGDTEALADINGPRLKMSIKISRMRGLISALRNESLSPNAGPSETQAYEHANEIISQAKRKITKRRDYILNALSIMDKKISSLENTHKNLKNYLQNAEGASQLLRDKLEENNFFEETIPMLNPSYRDYLSKSYYSNFVRSNRSLFTNYDKGDLLDLKIMYKVLTTKNYGFLEKEKFGRKNVYHFGIPLGMLDYLRRKAFKETGDEDYLDSSLICVTLHKANQINSSVNYIPKQFVFDISKHIIPHTYTKNGKLINSNHIKKATDDMNLEKVINEMETFIYNDRVNFGFASNGIGPEGIVGNRSTDIQNNYGLKFKKSVLKNHIFDYYLKSYTNLSTNIDISESSFLINSDHIFSGQSDNQVASDLRDKIYRKFLLSYPNIDSNPQEKEIFARSINILNNSVIMSSNSRLKEMMSMNCFERVFSVLVNDKDFVIDTDDDLNQIYQSTPFFSLSGGIQNLGLSQNSRNSKRNSTVHSFIKENNEKETSISGFTIEVGILKKW